MERAVKKYQEEARCNLLNHNYGKAYAFYLLVLKLFPRLRSEIKEDFCAAWREWSAKLQDIGRVDDLFSLYEQGCDAFKQCDMLHYHMGNALYQLDMKLEAVGMFRRALVANKNCYEAQTSLENACRGLVDSWHFAMLNDLQRNKLFNVAISRTLKNNDVVLDIGSGTGILSMFAVKHGAAKVYACEMSEVMQTIASECLSANGMETKISPLKCDSTKLTVKSSLKTGNDSCILPEKCPLVVSEIVDAGLLGEGIVDTLNHAWKNLLLPPSDGGRALPASAVLFCALIECEEIRKKHSLLGNHNLPGVLITSGVGIKKLRKSEMTDNGDFANSLANNTVINTCDFEPYTSEKLKHLPHKILSKGQKLFEVDFNNPSMLENIANDIHDDIFTDHSIVQEGYVDAIAMWFQLKLEPSHEDCSTIISTCINSEHCWDQAIYPVRSYKTEKSTGEDPNERNLVSDRLFVDKCDIIRLHYQVHCDCLFLSSVYKLNNNGEVLANLPQHTLDKELVVHVAVREEQMLRMNDCAFSNIYFHATRNQSSWLPDSYTMLDISNGFDLLAIKTAQVSNAKMHKYCQTTAIYNALAQICERCHLDIVLHNKLPTKCKTKFDAIVSDVIEPSGLLSPNAIHNICQLKTTLSWSGVVIPNRINVIAQCISSEELLSKCMLVSNENTLGLKIAKSVNDFRVSVHSDLDLKLLSYSTLSKPETVLSFNFNDEETDFLRMQKSIVVKVIGSGTIHAILFWFKINIYDDTHIDTSKETNHWKQAAYLFPHTKQLNVSSGNELVLKTTCQNDSIIFSASKYGG